MLHLSLTFKCVEFKNAPIYFPNNLKLIKLLVWIQFFKYNYYLILNYKMSKRYSGKSFKDASVMKKAKLTFKEKRKLKKEKKRKR